MRMGILYPYKSTVTPTIGFTINSKNGLAATRTPIATEYSKCPGPGVCILLVFPCDTWLVFWCMACAACPLSYTLCWYSGMLSFCGWCRMWCPFWCVSLAAWPFVLLFRNEGMSCNVSTRSGNTGSASIEFIKTILELLIAVSWCFRRKWTENI